MAMLKIQLAILAMPSAMYSNSNDEHPPCMCPRRRRFGRQLHRLPAETESGGYKGIWKKSLHLLHYLSHSKLGQQYDFVMKGDDDTFVNMPEMRQVLRHFNPAVPGTGKEP